MPPDDKTQVISLQEAIDKLNKSRTEQLKMRKELANTAQLEYNRLRTEIELLEEQASKAKDNAILLASLEQKARENDELAIKAINEKLDALRDLDEKTEEHLELIEKLEKLENLHGEALLKAIEAMKKAEQSVVKLTTAEAKLKKNSDALGSSTAQLAGSVFGLNEELGKKGFGGILGQAVAGGANFGDTLAAIGTELTAMLNPLNIVGHVIANTVNSLKEFAELAASTRQATMANEELKTVLIDSWNQTKNLGVEMAETAEAGQALRLGIMGITRFSTAAQTSMISLATTVRRLGIDTQDFVESQDFLVMSLGMTAAEAAETQSELINLGKALQLPPKIIAKDFVRARGYLARFGRESIDIFKQLEAQTKATGIEMGQLISVTEGFDTFEDAASKVAPLNALLGGGYFDTVEMVSTEAPKRMELMTSRIQTALEEQGTSWDGANYRLRQAIAAQLGGADALDLLNKALSNSDEALQNQAVAAAVSSGNISDLTDEAYKLLTPTDHLNAAMANMKIVAEPLITAFEWMVSTLADVARKLGPAWNWVVLLTGGFVLFRKVLSPVTGAIWKFGSSLLGLATKTMPVAASAGTTLSGTITTVGTALKSAAVGMLAFGGAVLMAGGGIALAATGLADLVASFKDLTGGEMTGAIVGMATTILGLTGMMFGLSGAVGTLGAAGTAGAIGLVAVGAAFMMMGKGIEWVTRGMGSLTEAFGATIDSIVKVGPQTKTHLGNVTDELEKLVDIVDEFDEDKLEGLTDFYTAIAKRPAAAMNQPVQTVGVGGARRAAGAAGANAQAQRIASGIATTGNRMAPAAPTAPAATQVAAAQSAGKREVILEVSGERLGKIVYNDYLKGRLQPFLEGGPA